MRTINLVQDLFEIYRILLIANILLSWFRFRPRGKFMAQFIEYIYVLTDPLLDKIRSLIKLNLGMFDFTPIIAFLLIEVLERLTINIVLRLI